MQVFFVVVVWMTQMKSILVGPISLSAAHHITALLRSAVCSHPGALRLIHLIVGGILLHSASMEKIRNSYPCRQNGLCPLSTTTQLT